jgi:hypothetical protein
VLGGGDRGEEGGVVGSYESGRDRMKDLEIGIMGLGRGCGGIRRS